MSLTDFSPYRILDCVVTADVSPDSNICKYDVYYRLVKESAKEGKLWLMGPREQFELFESKDSNGKLNPIDCHTKDYLRYELQPNKTLNKGDIYEYWVSYSRYVDNVKGPNGYNTTLLVRSFGCHCDRYELRIKESKRLKIISSCPTHNVNDHKSIVTINLAQAKPVAAAITFDFGLISTKYKRAFKYVLSLVASAAVGKYYESITTFIKGIL